MDQSIDIQKSFKLQEGLSELQRPYQSLHGLHQICNSTFARPKTKMANQPTRIIDYYKYAMTEPLKCIELDDTPIPLNTVKLELTGQDQSVLHNNKADFS